MLLVHLIPLKTTRSPYVRAMVQKRHMSAGASAPLNMACESLLLTDEGKAALLCGEM